MLGRPLAPLAKGDLGFLDSNCPMLGITTSPGWFPRLSKEGLRQVEHLLAQMQIRAGELRTERNRAQAQGCEKGRMPSRR